MEPIHIYAFLNPISQTLVLGHLAPGVTPQDVQTYTNAMANFVRNGCSLGLYSGRLAEAFPELKPGELRKYELKTVYPVSTEPCEGC